MGAPLDLSAFVWPDLLDGRQPQYVPRVRPELSMLSVYLPSIGADLVRGPVETINTAHTLGPFGVEVRRLSGGPASRVRQFPAAQLSTTEATIVLRGQALALGTSGEIGEDSAGSLSHRLGSHLPYSDGRVYWDFGGATSGTNRVDVGGLSFSRGDTWVLSAGPRGMEIWQNGILRASHGNAPTRSASTSGWWGIGAHNTEDIGVECAWYLSALSSKQLSTTECERISRDVNQLFEFDGGMGWPGAVVAAPSSLSVAASNITSSGARATVTLAF